MRVTLITLGALILAGIVAAEPCVIAPISAKDAEHIRRLVRAKTPQPIICIFAVSTEKRLPGSVTGTEYQFDLQKGTRQDLYTRTDSVSVHVGDPAKGTGDAYQVEKVRGTWKITSRTSWVMVP